MKAKKGVDGKLDKAWSKLVKLRAGMKCEVKGCKYKPTLNSHHIFSRRSTSTRWDLDNGLCLCVGHHTMSTTMSAHQNPISFTYWLEEYKGFIFLDTLDYKTHQIKKWTTFEKEELLKELLKEIKSYG
jgi:hypothetical protein